MRFLEAALGWLGRAKDKVGDLFDRIRSGVNRAGEIGEIAGDALLRLGDRASAWSADEVARLLTPVATAVADAQQNALITAAVGSEKLEAVRLAVTGTIMATRRGDEAFDAAWLRVRPFIEAFIEVAKSRNALGFTKVGE